ncbi:MAG TPA: mechanosensitive ion channel family protein [Cyclobacteriaceae bacterium]
MEQLESYSSQAIDFLWKFGPNLIGAVITLILGFWIIGIIVQSVNKLMVKREFDPSLTPFLKSLLSTLLKIMLVIAVIGMVGVEMTSFIAILGAAGLAVGLALQGTLQNFAGGVMILIFKPFKVGDFIDVVGYMGTVNQIQIFNTILKTPDNKTIIIPNGQLSGSSLTNFSSEPQRRVDFTFGIAYGDDFDKAKTTINSMIEEDERILKDPEPFIALSALADSSVNIVVRVWVNAENYWPVNFDMNEKVYKRFASEGLNIPFPQMDVHVHQN